MLSIASKATFVNWEAQGAVLIRAPGCQASFERGLTAIHSSAAATAFEMRISRHCELLSCAEVNNRQNA